MAIFGSLTGILGINTSAWTKGTETAGKDISALGKKTKSVMEEMKDSFGRGSGLDEAVKIFAGAGAIRGLTEGAEKMDEFVKKISTLNEELASGKITSGQYWSSFAEGLPVLGEFVELGEDWADLMGGGFQGRDIAAANARIAANKQENAEMEKRRKIYADTTRIAGDYNDQFQKQIEQNKIAGADGNEAKKLTVAAEFNDKVRELNKKLLVDTESDRIKILEQQRNKTSDPAKQASIDEELTPLLARQKKLYADANSLFQAFQQDYNAKMQKIANSGGPIFGNFISGLAEIQEKNLEHVKDYATKSIESARTPMQTYLADMEKLDVANKAHLVTSAQYAEIAKKNLKTLDESEAKENEYHSHTDSVVRGATSQVLKNPVRDHIQGQTNKTAAAQLAEQQKTNKILEEKAARGEVVFNF